MLKFDLTWFETTMVLFFDFSRHISDKATTYDKPDFILEDLRQGQMNAMQIAFLFRFVVNALKLAEDLGILFKRSQEV